MADFAALLEARDVVEANLEWIREVASGYPVNPPDRVSANDLDQALAVFVARDEDSKEATVGRWVLQSAVQLGFLHHEFGPELRGVKDGNGAPIGETAEDWIRDRLAQYQVTTEPMAWMDPGAAARYASWQIWRQLKLLKLSACLPLDPELSACRGEHPSDSNFITTVRASATFERPVADLARVYDPRNWGPNPLAPHITESVRTTDALGNTPNHPGPEAPGESWVGEYIRERVQDASNTAYLTQTLYIDFARTTSWARVTYRLGRHVASSGTTSLERDWGFIHVEPIPLPVPGTWSRVTLEKNIRFNTNNGTSDGGNIGWGRLANLLAPTLVAEWLQNLCYASCWDAPVSWP